MDLLNIIIVTLFAAIAKLWHHIGQIQTKMELCSNERADLGVKVAKMEGQIDILIRSKQVYDKDVMWVIIDYTGLIVDAGGCVPDLAGCRAAELNGQNVTCLLYDKKLIETHDQIFKELSGVSNRQVRPTAATGLMKRQDGKGPIEVVVKLSQISHMNQKCIKGYLFEVPVNTQ